MKKVPTRDKKTFIIAILSMAVVLLILLFGAFVLTNANKQVTTPNNSTTVTKVEKSLSGKSADDDKKDALEAAQSLLNAANTYEGDLTVKERLEKIDNSDYSVTDVDSMKKNIRFAGEFADDVALQNTTFQSLVTLSSYLTDENGKISPTSDTMYNYVYLDTELGIAFVPVSIFTDGSSAFSLEMVYVDGAWKLSPYSLLDIIRLSSNLSSTGSNN